MMKSRLLTIAAVGALAGLVVPACEEKTGQSATAPRAGSSAAVIPAGLFLEAPPADAKPVEEVKGTVKAGDTVALRGRIGGADDPFVPGRAMFSLMGPGLPACSDNPEDKCKTPWDYCCESREDIAKHKATIQVVDASGATLKADLKGQRGLKELSEVTVVGTVAQADGDILVVNATGLYVKP